MKNLSWKKLQAGRPLLTTREFATEFGIERRSLGAILRKATGAPKPALHTMRDVYYDPTEVRRWWATYSGPKKVLAPAR